MSTLIDIDTARILKQLKIGEQAASDFEKEAIRIQRILRSVDRQVSPNFTVRYLEVKEGLTKEIKADQFTKLNQALIDSQTAVRALIETDANLGGRALMDFKINMGELEETLTSLHKMKASLETLDGVLLNVQDVAAQQKGKLAEALAMEFGAHRDDISRQQGTVTKLFTYLENYVNDFKDIDSPTYRNQDMLIDARGLQKAAEMQGYALDDAKSEVFRVPQPSIESIPDDPDELWVMRHNQGLMEELDDYLRRKLTQLQQNEGEAMQRISQDMRKLLEMDQHHASIIEADYRHYDRNKVREIGASAIDTVIGFGLGAMDSLKHPEKHLESIAMLMKNLRTDPSGTAGMLWDGVVASYLEPYNKGDAYGLASSTIFFC